jgi:quercetin dioxygenase-like cupin family protein
MDRHEYTEAAVGHRSREHPETRFAPLQHVFDLRSVVRELAETPARRGHRQKALYRHGRLTVALFTFEQGASLADHVADGVVSISVLDGQVRVQSGGEEHVLDAGGLLILAPGVRHDVFAIEQSTMLLQVYLESAPAQ